MDESEKPSNQEESQSEETPAVAPGSDLLISELDSVEKMVVEKLNSDETKASIESAVINPVVSLAQGLAHSAKDMVTQVDAKLGSSLLHKLHPHASAADTETHDDNDNADHEQAPRSVDGGQTLVGGSPETRTSWMNCCGILELLGKPSAQ